MVDLRISSSGYEIVFTDKFARIAKQLKRRKPTVFKKLWKQMAKVSSNPGLGKPLRNVMRNQRRVHVGSFVLVYEVRDKQIRLLDFDHHDKIYKKY